MFHILVTTMQLKNVVYALFLLTTHNTTYIIENYLFNCLKLTFVGTPFDITLQTNNFANGIAFTF